MTAAYVLRCLVLECSHCAQNYSLREVLLSDEQECPSCGCASEAWYVSYVPKEIIQAAAEATTPVSLEEAK